MKGKISRLLFEPLYFKGDDLTRHVCFTFSVIAFSYSLLLAPLLFKVISDQSVSKLSNIFLVAYALHVAAYIISRAGKHVIGSILLTAGILFGIYSVSFADGRMEVLIGAAPFAFVAILILSIISSWQFTITFSILNLGLFAACDSELGSLHPLLAAAFETAFILFGIIAAATSYLRINYRKRIEKQRLMSIYHSRLASLSEMGGGIAHEINNPLTIIQGYAAQLISLVQRQQLNEEKVTHAAEKIIETSERISKTIYKLRSFARDGEGEPFREHPVSAVVESALDFCRARFRNHNIKLTAAAIPPELMITCRPVQMIQTVFNLLNNSFDAVLPLKEKWVHVEVKDVGSEVEIHVTDSGKGIPADVAAKIFDPYFTTKDIGQASGLGLSISNSLVSAHGGKIYLAPKSENTCFVISVPKTQAPAVVPAKAA